MTALQAIGEALRDQGCLGDGETIPVGGDGLIAAQVESEAVVEGLFVRKR